jgi:hypothetical protein
MLSIPTSSTNADDPITLSLSDNAIEDAESVKTLLDLLYGEPVPLPTISNITFVMMVKKYECAAARRLVLHAHVDYMLRRQVSPISVFRVAAMLDSVSTCELAIRDKESRVWGPPSGSTGLLRETIANQSTFDLRAMQYDMIETIPLKYSFALLRAHLVVELQSAAKLSGRHTTQEERDKMANEFMRLMA